MMDPEKRRCGGAVGWVRGLGGGQGARGMGARIGHVGVRWVCVWVCVGVCPVCVRGRDGERERETRESEAERESKMDRQTDRVSGEGKMDRQTDRV